MEEPNRARTLGMVLKRYAGSRAASTGKPGPSADSSEADPTPVSPRPNPTLIGGAAATFD